MQSREKYRIVVKYLNVDVPTIDMICNDYRVGEDGVFRIHVYNEFGLIQESIGIPLQHIQYFKGYLIKEE